MEGGLSDRPLCGVGKELLVRICIGAGGCLRNNSVIQHHGRRVFWCRTDHSESDSNPCLWDLPSYSAHHPYYHYWIQRWSLGFLGGKGVIFFVRKSFFTGRCILCYCIWQLWGWRFSADLGQNRTCCHVTVHDWALGGESNEGVFVWPTSRPLRHSTQFSRNSLCPPGPYFQFKYLWSTLEAAARD